ncbi:hypothetical protein P175DRAFT_0505449 [Aspergillus ochraceoroseus IBT 24754]|uniref:RRM domain-containing protein n=1 Tax=Aspergillus ochraceoroseus IBT 24754 TaxID=1392256 RepID=A0A2T5LKN4_9EURO|nr:uncharacterized protein P175DRAFT_0505449 [Aspergillus ochraceoroseus IBT 24754]PTU16841.1 hypothetical protein P175DRAFT_0505449 [Aspergillus ochraceoroseus IBT 24754]
MSVTPSSAEADAPKSASVTFEKDAAAKTALLLDQTQLGSAVVHVKAAQTLDEIAGSHSATAAEAKDENNHTSSKRTNPAPASSQSTSHTAISTGSRRASRPALTNFDKKTHASDRARGLDESYQISNKAASGWQGLNNYFEKALSTPSGQKLLDFYTRTDKQVRDIHNEARRLADLKSGKPAAESGHAAPPVTEAAAAPSTEKA